MRARSGVLALTAAAVVALSACGGSAGGTARRAGAGGSTSGRLAVVTTVSPITNIVATVAGDAADVVGIVPEGTNSHTFEPPPSAAKVLSRADLVLVNGLKLEDPTLELARADLPEGGEVVELGTRAAPKDQWIYDFSFPKEEGKPNPHLWTDPAYAIRYAEQARDALSRRDPAHAAQYARNCAAFTRQANALATAMRADQRTIPGRKVLLTYHDAYAYFARDFGWTVLGAVQPKDFEDPTPREVAALVDQVRAQRVRTIFGSEVFPSKVLEQIGRETGARYEATLRDDDLPGRPGDADHSWLGLMRYDYRTMVRGLGGTTAQLDALDVSSPVPDSAEYPQ
jgi:ABC-type Zn uptake system ZnuABC Zn-binding protein ZnuA